MPAIMQELPCNGKMQKNAVFTNGTPWAKINDNYTEINAEDEINDSNSVLNFYKKIISIRKKYIDLIRDGQYIPVNLKNNSVFSYIRKYENRSY